MTEPANRNAFLPQQRGFPTKEHPLQEALYKSYIDIAQAVNFRTIGIHERVVTGTGELWFDDGINQNDAANLTRRQSYRVVVTIDSLVTGSYPHGINFDASTTFTFINGAATNSTALTAIPLPYVDMAGAGINGVQVDVDAVNVNIVTSGIYAAYNAIIVLEFIPIKR